MRCVRPVVTLLDRIEAESPHWTRGELFARAFVRHEEHAACIVEALPTLPPVPGGLDVRVAERMAARQVRWHPWVDDPAFVLAPRERADGDRAAWVDLRLLFWGGDLPLDEAVRRV